METSENYLQSLDSDNNPMINGDYYRNIIIENINNYIIETGIERKNLTGNDLLAIFRHTQQTIFKPTKKTFPNKTSNIIYSEYNIQTLYNLFIDICITYKVHPSLFAFSILTGIDENTVKIYLTSSQSETLNLRREMLRNELASDKTGRIVLANNDSSYGLEYERKNTIERETIKQGLSLQDLPQLGASQ